MNELKNHALNVTRTQSQIIKSALSHWTDSGKLSRDVAADLLQEVRVIPFDWKKLAKYCMWIAIICVVTSLSAVFADQALLELLQRIFNASALVKTLGLCCLAALIYRLGFQRRLRTPEKVFTNEAVLCLGVLATAGAIYQLGEALDTGSGHFSLLLLFACFVYGAIGFVFESNLIWLFSLVSLGGWLGAETGYASGWGAYYLGMNYPLRFVVFGLFLLLLGILLKSKKPFEHFLRTTQIMGLLYFFIALWILSIFGNYGDMKSWSEVKQYQLFYWSLLFAAAACASIYHGLRMDNGVTKGFGITFLLINLYTRYFEYFWDMTHKAVFFAVMAASFWYLGSHAEKIWNMNPTNKLKQ